MGHKQPKGQLDIDKYEANGSYGLSLKRFESMLDNPITEEQMMRNWLLVKTAFYNAERIAAKI